MIRKAVILLLLMIVYSCTEQEAPTGATSVETGTLIVKVTQTNGTVLSDAQIYVNGVFKGKTNAYGESKGTKTVLLQGDQNQVLVKKEGFMNSPHILVSASRAGEQKIAVVLEPITSQVEIKTEVVGATVWLRSDEQETQWKINEKEGVIFEKVPEGEYSLEIRAAEFAPFLQTIEVEEGSKVVLPVQLHPLPHLEIEVTDNRGELLGGVELTLFTKKEFNLPGTPPLHVSILNSGKVDFKDVIINTTYVIIVKKKGFEAQTIEKTLTAEDWLWSIQLNPA